MRSNITIVQGLRDIAQLLELAGADRFRVLAYRRAADAVLGLTSPLHELLADGFDPAALPGVGRETASAARQLAHGGDCDIRQSLAERIPPGLLALHHVPGLGPKRIRALWKELGVQSPADLRAALRASEVREVSGFGPVLEERLLQGVEAWFAGNQPSPLGASLALARVLADELRTHPDVERVELAGELRRRKDAVAEAVLVIALRPGAGSPLAPQRLANGLAVRLVAAEQRIFGAVLLHATGAVTHWARLERQAAERGLQLTPQGLLEDGRVVPTPEEADIYGALQLDFVPPELREDRGEVEAAASGLLPELVGIQHIRGDLHSHTTYTDGQHSLEIMAQAARARGYSYLGITDHSTRPGVAIGLTPRQLAEQREAIARLNEGFAAQGQDFRLLAGCEVEILESGELNLPNDVLEGLDYCLCSVHGHFDLPRRQQTARLIRAMEHPSCHILGHPTGRATGMFPAMDLDLDDVFNAAVENNVVLEIDSKPERLDLIARHVRMAKSAGARFSISTDAHSMGGLAAMELGLGQARRAWLTPADVVNTLGMAELLAGLRG